jgi:antitoxin component YwqK of YwqJK toxin-antitoxin module
MICRTFLFLLLCSSCSLREKNKMQTTKLSPSKFDRLWNKDSTEYEDGALVNGKQTGLWTHFYRRDTTHYDLRFYDKMQSILWEKKYISHFLTSEVFYLSDGTYSFSYYSNGCLLECGYHRQIKGIVGEPDGLWKNYDSLGNLISETVYDYTNSTVSYKEYDTTQHFLIKDCHYFQESSEATLYKNGVWQFYTNGKLTRAETHKMESTLENIGE